MSFFFESIVSRDSHFAGLLSWNSRITPNQSHEPITQIYIPRFICKQNYHQQCHPPSSYPKIDSNGLPCFIQPQVSESVIMTSFIVGVISCLTFNPSLFLKHCKPMKTVHSNTPLIMAEFEQEKLQLNQLIQSLTKENQMLKQRLEGWADSKQATSDIHRAETKEDQSSILDSRKSKSAKNNSFRQSTVTPERSDKQQNEDLLRQNEYLRQQLDRKSKQYQKKISELSDFLLTLKQNQKFQAPEFNSSEQKSSACELVEMMQSIVKMFESDRQAFISKIEELLLLISAYQRKQREFELKERKFETELQIAKEQIVIFKRLQKSK